MAADEVQVDLEASSMALEREREREREREPMIPLLNCNLLTYRYGLDVFLHTHTLKFAS